MAGESFLRKTVILSLFFVCGAFAGNVGNILYHIYSLGYHDRDITFRKPWFQGLAMFVAMSLLVFDCPFMKRCPPKCPAWELGKPLAGWGLLRTCSAPAACDLTATILQSVALLWLPPSVWQMCRGVILIFTAILAVFYRHHRLIAAEWIGVTLVVIGITIVGLQAVLAKKKSDDDASQVSSSTVMTIVSIFLVIIAQAAQALQTVIEEKLLHDIDATDSEVVAFEGLWGVGFSIFFTMPLANVLPSTWPEGLYENTIESFYMLGHSWQLVVWVWVYMACILGLNYCGMAITSFSSAVHRNIYEALRSLATWVVAVVLHALHFPTKDTGEGLSWWSFLQAGGFIVSIVGTFIYNRVFLLPCLSYADPEQRIGAETALLGSVETVR